MKTLKENFLKALQAIVVVVVLAFSGNANATTTAPTALTSNVYALTGGWSWKSFFVRRTAISKSTSSNGKAKAFAKVRGGKTFTFTFVKTKQKPKKSIPLDGGLSILAIGAAAFGIKKLRGNKGENN
jgi:hypothetical protein